MTVEFNHSVTYSTDYSSWATADFNAWFRNTFHSRNRKSRITPHGYLFHLPGSSHFFWSWRGLLCHIGLDILCKSENVWPFRWENQTAVFDQNICPWLSAPTTRCQVGGLLLLSGWDKYLLWYHFIKTTGSPGKSKSKSGKLLNSGLYHVFFLFFFFGWVYQHNHNKVESFLKFVWLLWPCQHLGEKRLKHTHAKTSACSERKIPLLHSKK